MSTKKWIVLVNIAGISLLAVSITGCSILANAIRGGSSPNPSPTVTNSPIQEPTDPDLQRPVNSSTTPETKADALRRMNCREPSQTDYIYGTYQVGWTAKGDRYGGVLQMNGNAGIMKLKFFNSAVNSEDLVDQTMVLASCPEGMLLLGVNPRVPNTNTQHSNYVTDNILIRRETNGAIILVVFDDQGVIAPLEIQKVSN